MRRHARVFDLTAKAWVKDGFFRPEAKGGMGWIVATPPTSTPISARVR
jgi:hypothetical protein